jgi:hypothetical protein
MTRRLALSWGLCCILSTSACAECDLDSLVGYTLIARKYIDGWFEEGERKSGFEGCDFDRIIVFDDNTGDLLPENPSGL